MLTMSRVSRRSFLRLAGAAAAVTASGRFSAPAVGARVPGLGYRLPYPGGVTWRVVQGNNTAGSHQGLFAYAWDFRMPVGSPISAARGGVVSAVKQDSDEHGWGPAYADKNNFILIDHGDDSTGEYLHIPRNGARVRVGQRVEAGEILGLSGFTGQTRGPHLHFMVQHTTPGSWYAQSIPIAFADVEDSGGVPQRSNEYRSGNRRHAELELLDGRFYTQTNGDAPGGGRGYAVRDYASVPFWSKFIELGGVDELGYPISPRIRWRGRILQLCQRQALAWHSPSSDFSLFEILDALHEAGKDAWLEATYGVPRLQETGDPDDAWSWEGRQLLHQSVLEANSWLAAAYAGVPGGGELRFGYVTAWPSLRPDVVIARTQRAVLQLWKEDKPWARAGQVILANAGELLKTSNLFEKRDLEPEEVLPDRPGGAGLPLPWER